MADPDVLPETSAAREDRPATPSWIGKEEALNQRENRFGQSQANQFLWVLTFVAIAAVWGLFS